MKKHYLVDTNVVIDMLLDREVAEVNGNVIDMALKSGWKDFEDAVQNFSAVANPQISAIITRNTKDFKDSSLEVVDSVEFLNSKQEMPV